MYDLHQLGWKSFQQLCDTIVRDTLGQTVESFLDSHDGGLDGAFTGTWSADGQEDLSGPFVVQCKHTSRRDGSLRASDLTDEAEKARRLVEQGMCESYVLMTNAGVSGRESVRIKNLFKDAGVRHVKTYGSTWISQQIRENKRLRMLVPRIYGFGDLSQIFDDRAYSQAQSILESMREDMSKVVVTAAYEKAMNAIELHGFTLLIGEPAAGKTTIASLLAMTALDQWNASVLKLNDPGEIAEHWNPHEPSQFFWVDDAFGVTQYEDSLVRRWNHILPQIGTMLRREAKIVMTSRDYIYRRARNDLKDSAFPLLNESQVVIDAHALTVEERKQILYNHIRLGTQPRAFRTAIKPHLENVATHQRFIPETARRLANPLFTRGLQISESRISEFVEKREQMLQEILRGLDSNSKAALALIYMRNGSLESPVALLADESHALDRLGSSLGGCIAALNALDGSLVALSHASGAAIWEFRHPTIGDAYAALIGQQPELVGIYIQGSAPNRLINQVTCGDVGIENAIIVPRSLFPQVRAKLEEMQRIDGDGTARSAAFDSRQALQGFLARRCSREFLSFYLQRHREILDDVSNPMPMFDFSSEVRLAQRFHEFGLLPEVQRRRFVATVSDSAIDGIDASALSHQGIRTLFTVEELAGLIERVREDLLPHLGDIRDHWESNHSPDESPDDYLYPLFEFYDALKAAFEDDASVVRAIEGECTLVDDWIFENTPEEPETRRSRIATSDPPQDRQSTRSIFEDVDADEDLYGDVVSDPPDPIATD